MSQQDICAFVGTAVDTFGYGVETCVYGATVYFLLQPVERGKMTWINIAFVSLLWAFGGIIAAWDVGSNILAYVIYVDYPGGWVQNAGSYAVAMNVVQYTCAILTPIICCAVILYRTFMIWDRNYLIPAIGIPVVLGTLVVGLYTVVAHSHTSSVSLWSNLNIAYFALLCAQGAPFAVIIISRLLMQSRVVREALGDEHAKRYSSFTSIMIEAAVPLVLNNIVLAVVDNINSVKMACPIEVFGPMQTQLACITPQLIILRIALGKSWSPDLMTTLTQSTHARDEPTAPSSSGNGNSNSDGDSSSDSNKAEKGEGWVAPELVKESEKSSEE